MAAKVNRVYFNRQWACRHCLYLGKSRNSQGQSNFSHQLELASQLLALNTSIVRVNLNIS